MGRARDRADHRAGFAALAMFALLLQLAVPQGFMLARNAGLPAIVICTGHGPLLAPAGDHGIPAKAPKPSGACAFAGHGGTPTPAPGDPINTASSNRAPCAAAAETVVEPIEKPRAVNLAPAGAHCRKRSMSRASRTPPS